MIYKLTIPSPIDPLLLKADEDALTCIFFEPHQGQPDDVEPVWETDHPVLNEAARQLRQYFEGERTTFDVPLRLHGTAFQQAVWAELLKIPFGETTTYGTIATTLGDPKATRAVGAAVGRNPVSIIVPCHRVIGSTGAITGFAGGLPRKRFLLDLESQQPKLM